MRDVERWQSLTAATPPTCQPVQRDHPRLDTLGATNPLGKRTTRRFQPPGISRPAVPSTVGPSP